MKAILISIQPQYVADILNGKKTLEIRKKFPKDYVGWVYIYCTKGEQVYRHLIPIEFNDNSKIGNAVGYKWKTEILKDTSCLWEEEPPLPLNGKVIARFWCDKVEEHKDFGMFPYRDLRFNKATCLSGEDLEDYGFVEGKGYVPLYAIHITKLEIFDKPKEIREFKTKLHIKGGCKNCPQYTGFSMPYCATCDFFLPLNRAPQSWCYVEE